MRTQNPLSAYQLFASRQARGCPTRLSILSPTSSRQHAELTSIPNHIHCQDEVECGAAPTRTTHMTLCHSKRPALKEGGMDFSEQNKKVGAMWKVVEKEERQEYDEKARHAKEIHAVDMAAFREKCASFSSACCPSARSQARGSLSPCTRATLSWPRRTR